MVFSKHPLVTRQVESFRDWGRDCYCETGQDDTCGKRFEWQLGDLPLGYDHKYTYSHIGYNLKATDMQAALGLSQLRKLDFFVEAPQGELRLPVRAPAGRRGAHPPAWPPRTRTRPGSASRSRSPTTSRSTARS